MRHPTILALALLVGGCTLLGACGGSHREEAGGRGRREKAPAAEAPAAGTADTAAAAGAGADAAGAGGAAEVSGAAAGTTEAPQAAPPSGEGPFAEKAGYDPDADPEVELLSAERVAKASGRRILLEVGGEWCIWCHRLEGFLHADPEIEKALEAGFVLVKVNVSEENRNAEFLSRFPEVAGYPHLFVLDGKGKVLHSQDTAPLERDKSYDRAKVLAFLAEWAPATPEG